MWQLCVWQAWSVYWFAKNGQVAHLQPIAAYILYIFTSEIGTARNFKFWTTDKPHAPQGLAVIPNYLREWTNRSCAKVKKKLYHLIIAACVCACLRR